MRALNEYLNEGKYDKITGQIVDLIWTAIKITRPKGEHEAEMYSWEIDTSSPLYIDEIKFYISREPVATGVSIDAGAYPEENAIEVLLTIDPSAEPNIYNKVNSLLQDAVRHELEHLTQGGENRIIDRPKLTPEKTRNKIDAKFGNAHKYFTLKDEIPTMVNGMYRSAKTQKKPIDVVFNEYLNYYIGEKIITQKQADSILKVWIDYAKKNLPAAQYSEESVNENIERNEQYFWAVHADLYTKLAISNNPEKTAKELYKKIKDKSRKLALDYFLSIFKDYIKL